MNNQLLTAAQMRVLEQACIASGQATGLELMERAGQGAVDAILQEWPELAAAPGRALVLCGPGNNGGDGFVLARVLVGKGWDAEVFLYGDAAKLPPDARMNYERWMETGPVVPLPEGGLPMPNGATLVVDALFGTGLGRPLSAIGKTLRDLCDCVDGGRGLPLSQRLPHFPPVAAIDLPSGLCSDSGRVIGAADGTTANGGRALSAAADLTLSFHGLKTGHLLADGPRHCGKVRVVDIGLGESPATDLVRIARPGRALLGKRTGHKYEHGHALILTGGMGRTGAARLSARAALRVGSGLVTCAAPGGAMMECATQLTAVMLRRCDDAAALTAILCDERVNALCLGPGMGVSERTAELLDVAMATKRKIVLDADALSVLAARDDPFAKLHENCVLTPHGGEFGRLFPDIAGRLAAPAKTGPAYSKVEATRDAARRAGCTVLFKGPDTVIADERGRALINAAFYDRAVPWLATAGSGDVLAGLITGLLARGLAPLGAASSAAWLHVEAARAFGPGLIAEDLPEILPRVLAALER
ncbi:yjeF C-terminal region, hydroxyethylthiazole kinase-related/yjeF N-terminal region [Jannaschia faecimaris]|uniref:Bifunctional NAD(P)H-hydrate repair enzyme n=1 Tax=Jannaschia faecimaris TaxID=1244108 RepID=A0A1H3THC4_9RHOB|nr:NAD(P)H-hydrate dehydratase [Jannaschia faecimaris]SDZ49636.1 yjeF C-terminal region, hydroxyethylthiazole kinase-related/yjeF N-terminal region [Jannaschia faecimaris]